MSGRTIMGVLGLGRVVLGSALLFLPRRLVGLIWFGPEARRRSNAAASRAIGLRDIILGIGIAEAAFGDRPLTRWVAIGAATDALDAGLALTGGPTVPARSKSVVTAVVGGAAVVQTVLLASEARAASRR